MHYLWRCCSRLSFITRFLRIRKAAALSRASTLIARRQVLAQSARDVIEVTVILVHISVSTYARVSGVHCKHKRLIAFMHSSFPTARLSDQRR